MMEVFARRFRRNGQRRQQEANNALGSWEAAYDENGRRFWYNDVTHEATYEQSIGTPTILTPGPGGHASATGFTTPTSNGYTTPMVNGYNTGSSGCGTPPPVPPRPQPWPPLQLAQSLSQSPVPSSSGGYMVTPSSTQSPGTGYAMALPWSPPSSAPQPEQQWPSHIDGYMTASPRQPSLSNGYGMMAMSPTSNNRASFPVSPSRDYPVETRTPSTFFLSDGNGGGVSMETRYASTATATATRTATAADADAAIATAAPTGTTAGTFASIGRSGGGSRGGYGGYRWEECYKLSGKKFWRHRETGVIVHKDPYR